MHAYSLLPAEADRAVYRTVLAGLIHMQPMIPCDAEPSRISCAVKAVLTDYPGIFWFEGRWAWRQTPNAGLILPEYPCSLREKEIGSAELLRLSSSLSPLSKLPPLEAAHEVYAWLLDHAEYGITDTSGQSVFDALIKRRAVCKGLSKAYQFLLDSLGIFATLEEGTLDGTARHVWNVLRIETYYTNADVSFGYDCFSRMFGTNSTSSRFRWFAVGDTRLSQTHRWPSPKQSRLTCDFDILKGINP